MKNIKYAKIIIPLCIMLVIAGIWVFKNAENKAGSSDTNSLSAAGADHVKPSKDNDFALETDTIDLEALIAYGLPLIIDFGSDSCPPCREMAPDLETINAEMQGLAIIKYVDVWENANVARDFPLQVTPTQVFINADGSPYVPSDSMKNSGIEFSMYSYKDTGEHAFTTHQGLLTIEQMRVILKDMGVTSK